MMFVMNPIDAGIGLIEISKPRGLPPSRNGLPQGIGDGFGQGGALQYRTGCLSRFQPKEQHRFESMRSSLNRDLNGFRNGKGGNCI